MELEAPLYSRPALAGDALYLTTANRLYLIAAMGLNPVSQDKQSRPSLAAGKAEMLLGGDAARNREREQR
jgi:hypothetical protein